MIKSNQGKTPSGKSRNRVFRLALLGLFTALIILLSFTPLGYLKAGVVEISFLMIPVAVGAVLTGPSGGAILGGVFGVTSLIQAAFGMSAFGATLFGISPLCTILVCLVPRIAMGLAAGLVGKGLGRAKGFFGSDVTRSAITCLTAPLLNTALFMGLLVLFFWQSPYIQGMADGLDILPFIFAFVGVNGALEIAASLVAGTAISCALLAISKATQRTA